jgi:beta-N-acetylhexosaminidase
MVAHVFNRNIDPNYPATLSSKTINGLLRNKMRFRGVTITDDLQMGAIAHKYGLAQTLKLSINAGNDILLFGNQLNPKSVVSTKKTRRYGDLSDQFETGESQYDQSLQC